MKRWLWLFFALAVVAGAWVWMVPLSPPPATKTISSIEGYRAAGLLPKAGALVLSKELGHDIFEVPPGDARERARVIAALGRAPAGEADRAGKDDHAPKADSGGEEHEIKLDDDDEEAAEPAAPDGHGAGGPEAGLTILAEGSSAELAPRLAGLAIDRTIEVEMREWGYSPGHIMVEAGEVIRLKVTNAGALPHEFMLMDGVAMEAVDYRLARADWNLLEHRAIYEVPIVMPGRSFEVVAKIHRPGMWMYMCMFPYHMEQGMMGMLMTAGIPMDGMGAGAAAAGDRIEGVGVVVSLTPADGRMVLDHEAIAGYMGAMEMSYMVTPASLLAGLKPGDKVRFTIDAQKRMIVAVTVQ